MSTSNGYMHGKGRKVLNLVIEETQHEGLRTLAEKDHRSLAMVVRELLRQGLDTRHGLGTRQVASQVYERLDSLGHEVQDLRAIVVRQQGMIEEMARQVSGTTGLLDHVAALLKQRLPEEKKGWFS